MMLWDNLTGEKDKSNSHANMNILIVFILITSLS